VGFGQKCYSYSKTITNCKPNASSKPNEVIWSDRLSRSMYKSPLANFHMQSEEICVLVHFSSRVLHLKCNPISWYLQGWANVVSLFQGHRLFWWWIVCLQKFLSPFSVVVSCCLLDESFYSLMHISRRESGGKCCWWTLTLTFPSHLIRLISLSIKEL